MSYIYFLIFSNLHFFIFISIKEVKKSKVLEFQNCLHFLKEGRNTIIFEIFVGV